MAMRMRVQMLQRVVSGMRDSTSVHRRRFVDGVEAQSAVPVVQSVRFFTGSRMHMHSDDDFVKVDPKSKADHDDHDHDHDDDDDDDDDEDMEDVVDIGPSGKEYGGPQRGGKFKEPTRFGDWERKGRCTDF